MRVNVRYADGAADQEATKYRHAEWQQRGKGRDVGTLQAHSIGI